MIAPRWRAKAAEVRAAADAKQAEADASVDETLRAVLAEEAQELAAQAQWLKETIVEIIISEAQNEVADFKKWGFDIIPHRALMKQGFDTGNGERVDVETAFKNPKHPFRVAIICAMWLTGFDVECLSTLYIDKPMSRDLLASIKARLAELDRFWEKEQTKADVEVFFLDEVFASLPSPPFTPDEKKALAASVYAHVWQQAVSSGFAQAA